MIAPFNPSTWTLLPSSLDELLGVWQKCNQSKCYLHLEYHAFSLSFISILITIAGKWSSPRSLFAVIDSSHQQASRLCDVQLSSAEAADDNVCPYYYFQMALCHYRHCLLLLSTCPSSCTSGDFILSGGCTLFTLYSFQQCWRERLAGLCSA